VKRSLGVLSRQDPTGINSLERNIEDHNWRFSFNTIDFFVAAFAPCYNANHSRFSHTDRTSFIVLQPKHSFVRKIHGTANNWTQERSTLVKENIRKIFTLHSAPYDIALAKQPIVGLRYVQPAKIGDGWIRWWE
jgi:FPC/CPF motif-containing protein YcgG